MMELLAPAGSFEGVQAAVANGASAVYLGGTSFNARQNAKNFTEDELASAVKFAHSRGVKVYVTLNTILSDRELATCAALIRQYNALGVDALIVQDLGVLRLARECAPELPLHASTQMSVHSLAGLQALETLGVSRAVAARELTKEQLALLCEKGNMEIEVFVHGALCMAYSGQCYLSAMIGRRSGNRGLCAGPCRLPYRVSALRGALPAYPLSLKDNSLGNHLTELSEMGICCLKIEGRMKRPEYTAVTTKTYAAALKEGRNLAASESKLLSDVFSRQGFTDGYYTGNLERGLLGVREEGDPQKYRGMLKDLRDSYKSPEKAQPFTVTLFFVLQRGKKAKLAAEDSEGFQAVAVGAVPQIAEKTALSEERAAEQLAKTGGTPFACSEVHCKIDDGLTLPAAELNRLRREVLAELCALRVAKEGRPEGAFQYTPPIQNNEFNIPKFTISAISFSQLPEEVLALSPAFVYLPIAEILGNADKVKALQGRGIQVVIHAPRIIKDTERDAFLQQVAAAKELGVQAALCGTLDAITTAKAAGLSVMGDFSLNIYNSLALAEYARMGLCSAALSIELNLARMGDIEKQLPCEAIVYGRQPLMLMESCLVKHHFGDCEHCKSRDTFDLIDRSGAVFPLMREQNCRTTLYNAHKLFVAERLPDFYTLGLSYLRIAFSTEGEMECAAAAESYRTRVAVNEPSNSTGGLYYRGVL